DNDDDDDETGGGMNCGNGYVEPPDESCDGDDLAGESCMTLGFVGGTLTCTESCTFNATGCSNQVCGNGTVERDEECDGNDFGGTNCVDLGFGPGLPLCTAECVIDTSTCPTFGEGESCGTLNPCPNDLNCVSGVCYDGSPGAPCGNDFQCESNDCVGNGIFEDGTCN